MAEPAKIRLFWLLVAAIPAFVLGLLLFRGCGKTSPQVVTQYLPVNLDSLKATIPPDTITLPPHQITRIIRVPVPLGDSATVDSLVRVFQGQIDYYRELVAQLRGDDKDFGWNWDETVVLNTKESFYSDSITTEKYFHRWNITAEGPVKSYTYQIIPLCPMVSIPPAKKHHILLSLGGQFSEGLIRPVYSAGYGYKWMRFQAGYLPPNRTGSKSAFQVSAGVDIPLK